MLKEFLLCLVGLAVGLLISYGCLFVVKIASSDPVNTLGIFLLGLSVGMFIGYVTERG